MSDHLLTERMWRGWLEATGWTETEMPLDWCRNALAHYPYESTGRSLLEYVEAWTHGYRAALDDMENARR